MTNETAGNLPQCYEPWYELNAMYTRRMASCCYYDGPVSSFDLDRWPDMFSYWNGDYMRKVRSELVGEIPADSGCKNCLMYKYRTPEEMGSIFRGAETSGSSAAQRENWRQAIESFRQGKIVVDHVPLRFYFNFGVSCNINCIMCCQAGERPSSQTLQAEKLLAWKPHMVKSERVSIIGGEPLILPESLKFIRAMIQDDDYHHVFLDLYTNALTLDKFIDEFSAKQKISLCISLDAIGQRYEHIRAGSNWERVERNILDFKDRAAKRGLTWGVSTANIVMKSSLACIDDLVRWHVAHEIPPNFVDFQNFSKIDPIYKQENVFAFPHLLQEVPDWNSRMDESIRLLQNKGWDFASTVLRRMKTDLIMSLFSVPPESNAHE